MPNVQRKRLYSAALAESIPIKMTMAALRDVDKAGGLDEYLLKASSQKHLQEFGMALKERIKAARLEAALQAKEDSKSTERQLEGQQRAQIDQAFKAARRIEGPSKQ